MQRQRPLSIAKYPARTREVACRASHQAAVADTYMPQLRCERAGTEGFGVGSTDRLPMGCGVAPQGLVEKHPPRCWLDPLGTHPQIARTPAPE